MKEFLIKESGRYEIKMKVIALNKEDAVNTVYGYLPMFIDVESADREVTEVEK